jgi:hypothetical protein
VVPDSREPDLKGGDPMSNRLRRGLSTNRKDYYNKEVRNW